MKEDNTGLAIYNLGDGIDYTVEEPRVGKAISFPGLAEGCTNRDQKYLPAPRECC